MNRFKEMQKKVMIILKQMKNNKNIRKIILKEQKRENINGR